MRAWYARPKNRVRVISKVMARKHGDYAGVCKHCGGKTVGISKNYAPDYCGKPECRSVQLRILWGTYSPAWKVPDAPSRYFKPEVKTKPRPMKPRPKPKPARAKPKPASRPAPAKRPRKPREKAVGVKWLAD